MFQQEISQLNLPQLKAGEKRWLGNLQGSSTALLLKEIVQQQSRLFIVIARNNQHLGQLESELEFYGVKPTIFPDWEILPYDRLSPHQDIVSERLAILSNMPKTGVLLLSASTLAQRVAPTSWILGEHFDIHVGQKFDLEQQKKKLIQAGYHLVDTVYDPGEFAVRGSIMDIYASGQEAPIRIDLFDDEIESLKFFDAETQRTTQSLQQFTVLPAQEFPLKEGRATFRDRYAEFFPTANPKKNPIYQDVMDGIVSPGIEFYLPLFFSAEAMQGQSSLISYLPKNGIVITDKALDESLSQFWQDVVRRYEDRRHNVDQPIMPPESLFFQTNQVLEQLNQFARIIAAQTSFDQKAGVLNLDTQLPPRLPVDPKREKPFHEIKKYIDQANHPVLLVAESAGRRESLKDALRPSLGDIPTVENFDSFIQSLYAIAITNAPLERGLVLTDRVSVISENQLYEHRVVQRRRKRQQEVSEEFLIRSLTELTMGAPVVHIDYGVGRYAGLVTLSIDDQDHEFLQLDYADAAKVYVPVTNLHLISRYSGGDPDLAPLHKLGTDAWNKAKRKALEQIHDVAAELLHIQARRSSKPGISFEIDQSLYMQFASGFAYEETLDQANAIEATLHDMQQAKPMDRLVCGDVGFGKTEVAMRAAFVAVQNNRQVAILVPTTLLAQQHYDSFKDRFADWPVRIEVLSRFGSSKAHTKTIDDLIEGKVDIVIGTHKILQENVQFKNLGLMIVDEEHRFGVRDKERIKAMRADVDMLTLTATPIPRTLNMAFSGMRDLSIIATPPARRLAVKTFVQEHTDDTIKEAILRELLRGGQVYFLHNEVDTIDRAAEHIRKLVPEARVIVAHGQMRERELEQVMQQFYHKEYNVLVCSTIIETGIDVPNANTILIERADKLGLAQLHQLRGRVGRSHHQAYAYLMVPSLKALKGDAEKRLDAIQRASTLGAGFMLATEDLEIRGAGELLGEQQSGSMQAIGYSLYMEMLEKATKAIQKGKTPNFDAPLSLTAEITLHMPALIPDEYLGDVHQRLLFYKRISNTDTQEKLDNIRMELIDRFGIPPQPVKQLFAVHQIRLKAEQLGITKIDISSQGGHIEFAPDTPVQAMTIIQMMQKHPTYFRMDGGQRLKVMVMLEDYQKRIQFIQDLLDSLLKELH
ncbi:transcription-repair coupling factor [Acinetobacter lwoffii]|jgi:transcription-repair coupling factor (superfamily II helicase)|uniref:Transcription-repair-coupling factor n=4 Tax=Gammaproteobacteria TaxID=1236 RepID=A0A2K8URV7_ACILW|nr:MULTISPECIES: transcription-repair coupling factor [Pseudomonadota]ODN54119.1 transcription-repair coupling factor [Acinetobacter sp. 51m]AUC07998.1 transcription-repair coupling factor [Acinetobacter lwoffii]ENU16612.1 transcription-repair coupling factor [Acinetobacter sp. CIP A162]ENW25136.1 transcription-repair coupling factor [Acinetobacter lwoffii ATCC 9957 = CIP 70.31]ENX21132.1 transcription-repair coupling factor [Acinetobacter sp. CIP 102136]